MAKNTKKNKTNLEEWLLDFESKIGKGVVVSLLIEDMSIQFVSCVDKNKYLGHDDLGNDEEAGVDLKHHEELKKYSMNVKDYIG